MLVFAAGDANVYGKEDLWDFRMCEISGQMGEKTRNHPIIMLVSLFFLYMQFIILTTALLPQAVINWCMANTLFLVIHQSA